MTTTRIRVAGSAVLGLVAALVLAGCSSTTSDATSPAASVAASGSAASASGSPGEPSTSGTTPSAAATSGSATADPVTATDSASGVATPGTTSTPKPTRTATVPPSPTRTLPSRGGASGEAADLEEALEAGLATAVEGAVEVALAESGITLASGPDCTADLAVDTAKRTASGSVDCTGSTTAGLKVTAQFTGTVSAGGSCDGELVVKVGGRTVYDQAVEECSVAVS